LAELARKNGEDFQNILTRFVIERFLRRLGDSGLRSELTLKGANLFRLWFDNPHRPTRDLDLLALGESSIPRLEAMVQLISSQQVEEDGLVFDSSSVRGERIREDQVHEGVRVYCLARLDQARICLQIDFGFGDVVVPDPVPVRFPTLLDFPAPTLQAYPRETVIAEKTHALVTLGMVNSRMKDLFDLWFLASNFSFGGDSLLAAVAATFSNRKTPFSVDIPVALTEQFSGDSDKLKQWGAFLRKGRLNGEGASLEQTCSLLRTFLYPALRFLAQGKAGLGCWQPKGPWVISGPN
jgi:hypothetical protein